MLKESRKDVGFFLNLQKDATSSLLTLGISLFWVGGLMLYIIFLFVQVGQRNHNEVMVWLFAPCI